MGEVCVNYFINSTYLTFWVGSVQIFLYEKILVIWLCLGVMRFFVRIIIFCV
jgi:hypothetical protein